MEEQWSNILDTLTTYSLKHGIVERFLKASDNKKILEFHKNEIIKQELYKWIYYNLSKKVLRVTKSCEKSHELRKLGNEKYKQGDDETSLKLYTESVIHAPHGSPELSLALGNRSAVLFRARHYESCIKDVDLAIKNHKNEVVFSKLIIRKGKALLKLKRIEDGLHCLDIVKKLILGDKTLSTSSKNKLIDDLTNDFYTHDFESLNNEDAESKDDAAPPELSKGTHKSFLYASTLLDLHVTQKEDGCDRCVMASDDIEVGDVLFVEKPFSFIILPDYCENYCQYCCKLLIAPIACSHCVDCLFCDDTCYKSAYKSYHKWECKGFRLLQSLGVGHLALKTLLIAAQDIASESYKWVNDLVSHLNDIPAEDLTQYALTSTLLVIYLEKFTDFFKCSPNWNSAGEVGFIILKHMIQSICNGFAVKKSNVDSYDLTWSELSQVTYATGVYPSASMMNHSCGPNIITSFYNNLLVVRASKSIKKGEEIFNCYGPHFRKMPTKDRREILKKQFFFDCKCEHCTAPKAEIDEYKSLTCAKCKSAFHLRNNSELQHKCRSCSHMIDVRQIEDILYKIGLLKKKGSVLKTRGDYKAAVNLLEKCSHLQSKIMSQYNTEMLYCLLDCVECYSVLEDHAKCWRNLKKCIPIIKEQCGEYSMEYADILKKTIDVFLLDVKSRNNTVNDTDQLTDMLNYVDELIKVVELNFGPWSLEYSSLQSQKTELVILISCGTD